MRVACVQVALVDGEIEANRDRVLRMTEQALWERPELVVLPELATSCYSTEDYALVAEPRDGPTVEALATLAAATNPTRTVHRSLIFPSSGCCAKRARPT